MERCEGVYEEVRDSFEYGGGEDPDKLFSTMVVYGLYGMKNGFANIEHIYTDLWSGIAVKYQYDYKYGDFCTCGKYDTEDEDECGCDWWTYQDFWVECDQIHHGLARVYQLVKEFDEGCAN